MPQVVNFLPWRRFRRQRSARRWIAAFIMSALIIAAIGTAWRGLAALDFHRAALWRQSDGAIAAALAAAREPWQLRHQQWQQAQARLARQQNTRAWRQTLLALAERLPPQAWLTELRWQQNRLTLNGLASTFSALGELELRLRGMTGFHLQPPGVVARDQQGRWRFHYQLNREDGDDLQF